MGKGEHLERKREREGTVNIILLLNIRIVV